MCDLIAECLAHEREVHTANDLATAGNRVAEHRYDVVLVDLDLGSQQSGLELCAIVARHQPSTPVIIITGRQDADAVVQAERAGAYHCIGKPLSMPSLALLVARATEHRRLRDRMSRLERGRDDQTHDCLLGDCRAIRDLVDLVDQVAPLRTHVIIEGESGVGKSVIARRIHRGSTRANAPLLVLHCAELPDKLWDDHGSVAGADTGILASAAGGTVVLDEVCRLAPRAQRRLLRAMPHDVRFVATSSTPVSRAVEEGGLCRELFDLLQALELTVPPLRERGNDTILLAYHFLERARRSTHGRVQSIAPDAVRQLLNYGFPGNVRELRQGIEHAAALAATDVIGTQDLPTPMRTCELRDAASEVPNEICSLDEVEQLHIQRVLTAVDGNKSRAARLLGVDRRTLYRKLERSATADPISDPSQGWSDDRDGHAAH